MPDSLRVPVEHVADLPDHAVAPPDPVDQVRPIERADQELRIVEPKLPGDVLRGPGPWRWRCRRGSRRRGRRPSEIPSCRYSGRKSCPQTLMQWASSIATNETRHWPSSASESLLNEPLRREVEELQRGRRGCSERMAFCRSPAGSVLSRHAAGTPQSLQGVDLVLHQRDQRRDDQRQAREQHGRRLETERFAAAGGQDDDRIAPADDARHRLVLQRQEAVVAPVLLQDLENVFRRGSHGSEYKRCFGLEQAATIALECGDSSPLLQPATWFGAIQSGDESPHSKAPAKPSGRLSFSRDANITERRKTKPYFACPGEEVLWNLPIPCRSAI